MINASSSKRNNRLPCTKKGCNKKVNRIEDNKILECKNCQVLFNVGSLGYEENEFELFVKSPIFKDVFWCCEACRPKVYKIMGMVDLIEDKMNCMNKTIEEFKNTIDKRLENIENKVNNENSEVKNLVEDKLIEIENGFDKLEKTIVKTQENEQNELNEKFKSYANAVSNHIEQNLEKNKTISSINNNLKSVKDNIETNIVQQDEERAKKQKINNIILFNIPESSTGDEGTDYENDIIKLKNIFKDKIQLQKEDFKKIYRKETRNKSSRPRPIIIQFTTTEKRNESLRIRNLAYTDPSKEKHFIFIHPDRTKQEQDEHKVLVNKLKERKKEDPDLIIRNGKIVKKTPFRSNPQSLWG